MDRFSRWQINFIIVLFFVCLTFITYSNSLSSQFMMDDRGVLFDQTNTPGIHQIGDVFNFNQASAIYYRPVSAAFRSIANFFLPHNPFYYHILNIILFSSHCSLIFFLLKLLFKEYFIPFTTSVLYGVHPIHAIAVNYITAHEVILLGIFLDLSTIFFIFYIDKTRENLFLILSLLCFVAGLFTQEIAIVFPLILLLITFQLKMHTAKSTLKATWPYCLIAVFYIIFRVFVVQNTHNVIHMMIDYAQSSHINGLIYFQTIAELIFWYLKKLVLPQDIVLIWSLKPVPQGTYWAVPILAILIPAMFITFRKRWKGNACLFSLLWLMIGFLPLAGISLIYPGGGFSIEPHWFFFSSIGFFILSALALKFLCTGLGRITAIGVVIGLAGALGMTTKMYNQILESERTYCRYWVSIAPDYHLPNFWLGDSYLKEKNFEQAKYFFKRALIGRLIDWQVYANLGDIERARGHFEEAERYYLFAIKLAPLNAQLYDDLRQIYLLDGKTRQADNLWRKKNKHENMY